MTELHFCTVSLHFCTGTNSVKQRCDYCLGIAPLVLVLALIASPTWSTGWINVLG
jgi:hypothetical protein